MMTKEDLLTHIEAADAVVVWNSDVVSRERSMHLDTLREMLKLDVPDHEDWCHAENGCGCECSCEANGVHIKLLVEDALRSMGIIPDEAA